jgi:hypothetical protein
MTHPLIGTRVYLEVGGIWFACRVIDAKNSYGKPRLQIIPVAGTGTKWVLESSVSPDREAKDQPVKRCWKCGSPVEGDNCYLQRGDGTYEHIGGCPQPGGSV